MRLIILFFSLFLCAPFRTSLAKRHDDQTLFIYKNKVKQMFDHAYWGYMKHAFPYDELRPLTCDGQDTWGSYSLTLIDSLDTLVIMGNHSEFRRAVEILLKTLDFDKDLNVSVFETNIRVVGGLLSAHLLSKKAGLQLEDGWPCSGPLLRLAEKVARKLLPAFNTPTGMPYGTINLLRGVPEGETPVTCTAGVGTFIVEFGALTQLTGATVFMETALRALQSLWSHKSSLGLVGNHINVATGKWTALDSTIGAGVDSYFEYLVKGAMLFGYPDLMKMFIDYKDAIEKHLKKDDWYLWAHMEKGSITNPLFQSLEAFWPGLLSLTGDMDSAMKSLHNYHQIWRQYGFIPEFYNIPKSEAHPQREGYPLRPELVESIMYLYRATKDPSFIDMAIDVVETIEYSCKTPCGYATVKNVKDHSLDNRMESFFLAETLKYLYLIFDVDNFIHNDGATHTTIMTTRGKCFIDAGGYVFNTEAHPIDSSILYCCSHERQEDLRELAEMTSNTDLTRIIDFNDHEDGGYLYEDFDLNFLKMKMQETSTKKSNDGQIQLDEVGKNIISYHDSGLSKAGQENNADVEICRAKPSLYWLFRTFCMDSDNPHYGDEYDETDLSKSGLGEVVQPSRGSSIGQRAGSFCPVLEGQIPYLKYEPSAKAKDQSQATYKVKGRPYSTSMHELLTCRSRPFHARFSILGQMFEDDGEMDG